MSFPYRIVVEWSQADECYVARIPAIRGCAAHGDTVEEATHEAEIAGRAIVEEMGDKAPPAEIYSGEIRLRMPRSLHASLARRAAVEGVSLNAMMVSLLSKAS